MRVQPGAIARRLLHSGAPRQTLWSFLDDGGSNGGAYQYSLRHSQPEPPVLASIREAALVRDPVEAQKMISPLQGAFMRHLVRSQRPQTVLELGCYVGYSALWLAHGLQSLPGLSPPKLWTCERDSGIANLAKDNIKAAGLADTVHVLNASAKHVLEEWDSQQKLDLVFVDANKSACQLYYDLIMDRDLLSDHGQIIVDNVLFHGQVHPLIGDSGVSSAGPGSNIAHKMHRFNEHVAIDQRTDQVLLPMFDGLLLIQRVK